MGWTIVSYHSIIYHIIYIIYFLSIIFILHPQHVWLAVFNHSLHLLQFWQGSAWRFYILKLSLTVSNQRFLGWLQLLFPSTSKFKVYPLCSSVIFTCLNQHSFWWIKNHPSNTAVSYIYILSKKNNTYIYIYIYW